MSEFTHRDDRITKHRDIRPRTFALDDIGRIGIPRVEMRHEGRGQMAACLDIAEEESRAHREAVIVTILPDSADKYLSERFWSE